MTFRQRLGLSVPPYLLRLALAATFIWSGSVKFQYQTQLSEQEEVTFAAIRDGSAAATPKAPADDASAPDAPAPDAATPADADEPAGAEGESTAALTGPILLLVQNTASTENTPTPETASEAESPDTGAEDNAQAQPRMHLFVARLALKIHAAATPDDQGRALLPAFMGTGKWPLWLAYGAGLTELIGGVAILLGLFTRLWSLGMAAIMATALWMTSIGPVALMGAPGWPSFMPILPSLNGYAVDAWQMWLWKFMLGVSALSLACLGPGSLSLDHLFFRRKARPADTPDDHDN